MVIALTTRFGKRLKQLSLQTPPVAESSLYDWTATLTNVYEDTEDDLLILLNDKTRLAFYA